MSPENEFPLIQLDDENDELLPFGIDEVIRNSKVGGENDPEKTDSAKDYRCVECTMEFGKENELRQHVRYINLFSYFCKCTLKKVIQFLLQTCPSERRILVLSCL